MFSIRQYSQYLHTIIRIEKLPLGISSLVKSLFLIEESLTFITCDFYFNLFFLPWTFWKYFTDFIGFYWFYCILPHNF